MEKSFEIFEVKKEKEKMTTYNRKKERIVFEGPLYKMPKKTRNLWKKRGYKLKTRIVKPKFGRGGPVVVVNRR